METLPGLWNIPASLALYPIARSRTAVVPLRTRIERVARGVDMAVRSRGIFHYWFHPETLAEAPGGFSMLDAILEKLIRARNAGDIEVLTMAQVADRMELLRVEPVVYPKIVAGLLDQFRLHLARHRRLAAGNQPAVVRVECRATDR